MLIATLTIAAAILAQATPPATDAPRDILRGPTVNDTPPRPTLVRHAFDGALIRIEARPEEAALDLLGLAPEEREAARAVLTDRAAQVDQLVLDNVLLLVNLANAVQARDNAAIAREAREARRAFAPLNEGDPLIDRVASTLTPAHASAYREIVNEYTNALSDDLDRERKQREATGMGAPDADNPNDNNRPSRRARFRERMQNSDRARQARLDTTLILEEARRSYDRITALRLEQSQELLEVIDPTPEQRAQINDRLMQFAIDNEHNPSPEARATFAADLLRSLTPEQRRRVVEHYRKPAPPNPASTR